jgi:Tol biopolymer transport system component
MHVGLSPMRLVEVRIALGGDGMFRTLRIGLLVVLLTPCAISAGVPSGHMEAVSVSPDGKLLAVVYEYEDEHATFIYKVSVDTGVATRLTDAKTGWESNPTFSADAKQIAYSYTPGKGEHSRIMIGDVNGSNFHVWSLSQSESFRPLFSPDGKTIILAHSGFFGSYSPIAQPHPHDWSFYAADLDGSNVRQLTNESFYMASEASVSPDGKSMAVVTEGLESPTQIAIYSLDHPGEPHQSLQPHVPKEPGEPIYNSPNFLANGTSILFLAARDGIYHYDYDVYRLDLGTGIVEKLTTKNGYATNLKVFADGKTAVFFKWHSNWRSIPVKSDLYFLDLESHKLTPFKVIGLN